MQNDNTMKIYLILTIILFISSEISAQSRFTKCAENGYSWLAMEESQLPYNNTRYNYLSGILGKNKIMRSNFPGSEHLLCQNEINQLLATGKSESFSLEDVLEKINEFYSIEENLIIPIIFSYCYIIKKEAGLSREKLKDYIEDVNRFCAE